jgi:hypothetical protein
MAKIQQAIEKVKSFDKRLSLLANAEPFGPSSFRVEPNSQN